MVAQSGCAVTGHKLLKRLHDKVSETFSSSPGSIIRELGYLSICSIDTSSIDEVSIENIDKYPNSLIIEPGEEENVSETLSCSLFRSLCPVTAQPDWATIYISYKGNAIQHSGLLRYLLSYRNHQGFHEECVERIYIDILKRCRIDELCVRANFLRRGGIEINPVRTTPNYNIDVYREIRQ